MRVLVFHSELGVLRGGGENFTRNLFAAFVKRGHSVAAAFVADQRNQYPIPLPPNIEPIPLKGRWSRNLGQATLSTVGRSFADDSPLKKKWDYIREAISWRTTRWHNRRFQQRVERVFSNRWSEFDAIYVHGDPFLASHVARCLPTVLRLPGPVSADHEPELRAAHAVCANGDALVRIRTFLGDHATELPVGIDSELFSPGASSVRSRLNWTDKHLVIGYVGRFTYLKGVDLLAAAFRELSLNHTNLRLLMVGSGAEERSIRPVLPNQFARRLVHIEPDVNHWQLPEWYRAMDVLVMPSRYENFSNAVLEGMACGIPFLASNIGGNRILAKTGAGWLFESGSVASLSTCLDRILKNISEIQNCGNIGSCYVRQYHSWRTGAEILEDIITLRLGVKK